MLSLYSFPATTRAVSFEKDHHPVSEHHHTNESVIQAVQGTRRGFTKSPEPIDTSSSNFRAGLQQPSTYHLISPDNHPEYYHDSTMAALSTSIMSESLDMSLDDELLSSHNPVVVVRKDCPNPVALTLWHGVEDWHYLNRVDTTSGAPAPLAQHPPVPTNLISRPRAVRACGDGMMTMSHSNISSSSSTYQSR